MSTWTLPPKPVEPAVAVGRRARPTSSHTVWQPCVTTAIVVVLTAVSGIRGADYPAHQFRAALWSDVGPSLWNFHWYGGHPTATYGILSPPIVALLGACTTVSVAALVSTYCFSRLTIALVPGPTTVLANHAFAVTVSVNVIVGRVAFGVGLALGLIALLAWRHGLLVVTAGAAGLAGLASPVAGVFVVITAAAVVVTYARVGVGGRSVAVVGLGTMVASATPLLITGTMFDSLGTFPFRSGHLMVSLGVLAVAARWCRPTVLRVGAGLACTASLVAFAIPNPLGGNVVRLPQIVGVPMLIVAIGQTDRRGRSVLVAATLLATGWSLSPGFVAASDATGDPSIELAYHLPLIREVSRRNADGAPIGRLEIPFTVNHWESHYIAADVPFARGWERQADVERNAELYDPVLDEQRYRRWLDDHAVRWIAVPDVAIDDDGGGLWEREFLESEAAPWLRLVWSDAHWQLFEVADHTPIVEPPGALVEQAGDRVRIRVDRATSLTIRYAYDARLTMSPGACLRATADGWIEADLPHAGEYELRASLTPSRTSCVGRAPATELPTPTVSP